MLPHRGALTQALCNRGYKIHFHQVNAPSPQDTFPEAHLPTHTTHNGGGCWLAYNKHTPFAATIRPLLLPGNCLQSTTCAVELTLASGPKSSIIASYLPQGEDSHAQTWAAITELTHNLPHHIQILGVELQGNWTGSDTKDANIRKLPHDRWKGPAFPTFKPQRIPEHATCTDHLAIWDPHNLSHQIGHTTTVESAFLKHNGILGKIFLLILIPPAKPALIATRPPRVPTFQYPAPAITLERWKTQATVEFHSPVSLAITTATTILDNLETATTQHHHKHGPYWLGGMESVLSLAVSSK